MVRCLRHLLNTQTQLFIFARYHENLDWHGNVLQRMQRRIETADSETAAHQKHCSPIGGKTKTFENRFPVFPLPKLRRDGDAGHEYFVLRQSRRNQIRLHFLPCDEITVRIRINPHLMHGIIGDDRRIQEFLRMTLFSPGSCPRRKRMRANHRFRSIFFHKRRDIPCRKRRNQALHGKPSRPPAGKPVHQFIQIRNESQHKKIARLHKSRGPRDAPHREILRIDLRIGIFDF